MSKDTTKTKKTRQAAEKASKKPIEGENIDYAVTAAKRGELARRIAPGVARAVRRRLVG